MLSNTQVDGELNEHIEAHSSLTAAPQSTLTEFSSSSRSSTSRLQSVSSREANVRFEREVMYLRSLLRARVRVF